MGKQEEKSAFLLKNQAGVFQVLDLQELIFIQENELMPDSDRQVVTYEMLEFNHEACIITEECHSSTEVVFGKGFRSLELSFVLGGDLVELGSCLYFLDQEAGRVEVNELLERECYRCDISLLQFYLILLSEHADDSSSHQKELSLLLVDCLFDSLQRVDSFDELIVE